MTLGLSTTAWWAVGYAIGGGVVVIAAALLVTINLLARRIVSQTAAIALALDGAVRNTDPLFDVAMFNHSLESLTRGLKNLAGEHGDEDERGFFRRLKAILVRG
jgi:hypothetical protein